jgi:branched-chain amino acid transport system substrate-binding protein
MRNRVTTSVVVAALVAVAACKQPAGDKGEQAAPASDTILVGEYGSLTGSEATFGQSTHKGVMLAVDEINAAGGVLGKKVAVKTYDTAGRTQEAGTAVTRLITDDKVVAVLGEVASSLSIAGGRVAQQYGVPMITPSSTAVSVTQIGDMISRVCFIDPFQGYVAAKFAKENLSLTKAAILYDQAQAYSKGLKDDFKKAFIEMGGTITSEQAYSGGDQDYSAQLTSIKEGGPQIIYVPGYYTDVGNIALQARKLGLTAPLLGGDGWDSEQLAKIAGPAIDGSYFSNHYSPQDERPQVKNFVERFKAKNNGEIPDGLAALGYDAAKLLFDAMKRAGTTEGKALAKAINETKGFDGVTGSITIDANRNAEKSAVMVEMKNGERTYKATIEPKRS